jgi:hypothetical protein
MPSLPLPCRILALAVGHLPCLSSEDSCAPTGGALHQPGVVGRVIQARHVGSISCCRVEDGVEVLAHLHSAIY